VFTHRFTLDEAEDAYRRMENREMGKGVFTL
jgi:threonine dehydrogenase-like Zn-dependent dehydrogenase